MTFSEYLRSNSASFVKPTANLNGLNFRTAEGKVIGTILMQDPPVEDQEILQWVKDHFVFNVRQSTGSNIISLQQPVDKGMDISSLFESSVPVKAKK